MRDIFTPSFDYNDIIGTLLILESNNDWNSNYPWLDVFETLLSVSSDMQFKFESI